MPSDKTQTNIPIIDIKVGTAVVTDAEGDIEEVSGGDSPGWNR